MFDTMVITKIVAGLCAALLFFLVGKWAADVIYMPGHTEEYVEGVDTGHSRAVYPIFEDAGDDHGAAEEAVAVDVAALYAEADAGAGESLWRNCRSCHSLEVGRNGTGPSLHGVVGRPIDSIADFNYSGALTVMGDTWTVEALNTFLEDPRARAPGTRMSFSGLRNIQDRLNLIKYLEASGT